MTENTTTAASGAASHRPIQRGNLIGGIVQPDPNGEYVRYVDHVEHVQAARAAAPAAQGAPEGSPGLVMVQNRRHQEVQAMKTADSDGRLLNAQGHQQAINAIDFCIKHLCADAAPRPQADAGAAAIAPDISADLERSDWTAEEALRWYAAGKHYDTVPNGDGTSSARILDNGAVASNALKSLSREYAEHKGDVALQEAAAAPQAPAAPTADDALNAAVEKSWDRFQQAMKPANGEPPAVPYAQHERELAAELEQREQAESVIDLLCDAVLGPDRAEWSSAYGYQAAINEVSERIAELERKAAPEPAAPTAAAAEREYSLPVKTVADLVNNLLTMDQSLPIYAALSIQHDGRRRTITMDPTLSLERVKDGRWIGEGDSLNAAVVWSKAEQPASAPEPAAEAAPSGTITQPYTVSEIRERVASGDYSAELMLQHALLHLGAGAAPTDAEIDALWREATKDHGETTAEFTRWFARAACARWGAAAPAQDAELRAEVARLNAIINTPQADDFLRAVSTEAEHQRQRWSSEHDAGKTPADWFWLVGYLAGKALHAHAAGNAEKAEHHIITTAAALANWHLALLGKTNMRPGIDAARARQQGGAAC